MKTSCIITYMYYDIFLRLMLLPDWDLNFTMQLICKMFLTLDIYCTKCVTQYFYFCLTFPKSNILSGTGMRYPKLHFKYNNHDVQCHVNYKTSINLRKPTFWHKCPTKTQISLRFHAVWSESSLSARKIFSSLAIQNTPSHHENMPI